MRIEESLPAQNHIVWWTPCWSLRLKSIKEVIQGLLEKILWCLSYLPSLMIHPSWELWCMVSPPSKTLARLLSRTKRTGGGIAILSYRDQTFSGDCCLLVPHWPYQSLMTRPLLDLCFRKLSHDEYIYIYISMI